MLWGMAPERRANRVRTPVPLLAAYDGAPSVGRQFIRGGTFTRMAVPHSRAR